MSKLTEFYSSGATSNHENALVHKWYHSVLAHDDRYRFVARWLDSLLKEGWARVLDVACWVWLYEQAMDPIIKSMNYFIGLDISVHQIEHTKSIFDETVVGDIEEGILPFPDEHFDLIILSEIIEHLVEPENIISECKRVLKNGGKLILTTPNLWSLQNRLSFMIFGTSREIDYKYNFQHIRFFSSAAIKDLFSSFHLIGKRAIGSMFFYPNHFPIFIPVPRFLQIIANRIFPNLGLSFFRIYVK